MADLGDEVWAALGARLRACGLGERALRHRFAVRHLGHAPLGSGQAPVRVAPAALLVHLFAAGDTVSLRPLRRLLGDAVDLLDEAGLIAIDGDLVRARVAILPLGDALVVSDRADCLRGHDVVACADDSAFHLLSMVPTRPARPGMRWLDVGTGSAIVPLARPGSAAHIAATDIHVRALEMARIGAALSGRPDIELREADLLADAACEGPWDRITFNAPIPNAALPCPADTPLYRRGADDVLERFWEQVGDLVAPAGEVIVHSWQPLDDSVLERALPGRLLVLRYTPPGAAPAFGVSLWQPDAPRERRLIHQELSASTPYLVRGGFERLLAG
ncbi:methyltransferase small [Haliangium ochraceum]|uniref:Methyltransferase small n=1 Tax=Haliangium ochraceum (strain DSM 14365 / JCM 11303 / SMP-2) TaxID=502025 RepID=D0LFV6_HALO1|nr:methyltransferase small [Haliangium ochraceum]ACY14558.1 methyltransferase small [Haliangium ochraceum DSM 14365]